MTTDEEIRAGWAAKKVLDEPLFRGAFEAIEANIIDKMRRVPMADTATQHELVLSLQLLGSMRAHFDSMIQTGKMAEIQKEQSLAKRVAQRFRKP